MTDTTMSVLSTEDGLYLAPFPQFRRADFVTVGPPSITPVPPATDLRPGTIGQIVHGTYSLPPDRWLITLEHRDGSNTLLDAVNYDVTAPDNPAALQFTVPDVEGGAHYLVVRETPYEHVLEDLWRIGLVNVSEATPIIVLDTPHLVTGPTITTPGGSLVAGVLITCAGYDYDPDDAVVLFKWLRDGSEVPGATASTYLTTDNADGNHDLICKTYIEGYEDTTSALSNALLITTPAIVPPAFVPRSKFRVVETSTVGHNGTRDIQVGVDAGGSAVTIPAGWTLYTVTTNGTPSLDATINAGNTVPAGGSTTFARSTEYAVGTVVRTILGWRHDASNQRFYATDQADLIDVGGGQMEPYGAVKIVGVADPVDPPPPGFVSTAALFDPPQGFIDVAAAASNTLGANGTSTTTTGNATAMTGTSLANAILASAMGSLKGHADARTDLLRRIRYTINDGNRNPTLSGGNLDRANTLIMAACALARYDPVAWPDLQGDGTATRIDLAMKAAAIEAAFVSSDACPGFTGPGANGNGVSGKPKTITGYSALNLKNSSPSYALMGPAMCYITMAYFGTATAWLDYLNSVDQTAYDALRASLSAQGMKEIWTTLTWKDRGVTTSQGTRGGLSTDAPTDAQVLTAIHNPKWFGLPLGTEYSAIMAMMTSQRRSFNGGDWLSPAWLTGVIRRGWAGTGDGRGLGADSDGGGPQPAAKVVSGAVNGCQAVSSAEPPLDGAPTGGADELYRNSDDSGPVSAVEYAVCCGRAVFASWLCMWVAGLLNHRAAEIATSILAVHRAFRDLKFKDSVGYIDYKNAAPSVAWPQSLDWQRHGSGAAFNSKTNQGGSLFDEWFTVLGPALGCGPQLVRNGTFDTVDDWTGVGSSGRAITGGKLVFTAVPANTKVTQSIPFLAGQYVQVEYTISSYTSGSVRVALEGGTAVLGTVRSAGGTFKERLLVGANNGTLSIYPTVAATLSIDNIVVSGPWDLPAVDEERFEVEVVVEPPPDGNAIDNLPDLLDAISAASSGAHTILVKGGTIFKEFIWPGPNRSGGNLSNPLIIRSSPTSSPAVFRGINMGGEDDGQFKNIGTPNGRANTISGVWLDYITIKAERFDHYRGGKNANQTTGNVVVQRSGAPGAGEGYGISVAGCLVPNGSGGWKNHPSWDGKSYVQANFGMVGLSLGSGCNNIRVTNSEINGFHRAIRYIGCSNIVISQCFFNETAVDVNVYSGNRPSHPINITLCWNVTDNYRGPSKAEAASIGYGDGQPHSDQHQSLGDPENLNIHHTYMHDTSGRMHASLLNSGGESGDQRNFRIFNNETKQSHYNGWTITTVAGIELAYNKSTSVPGDGTLIELNLGGNSPSGTTGPFDVHHNESPKFASLMTGYAGDDGNVTNNNPDHYPTGFTHIRQNDDARPANARFCGIGGNINNAPWDEG